MSHNLVQLIGRVPFDHDLKNSDDEARAFLGFSFSVQRSYKKEDEKYYPEDLIYCKAFGQKAIFINQYFPKGAAAVITGSLFRDDDYEKDGEVVKGQMYVRVEDIRFVPVSRNDSGSSSSNSSAPAKTTNAASKPAAKPAATSSSSSPFKRK